MSLFSLEDAIISVYLVVSLDESLAAVISKMHEAVCCTCEVDRNQKGTQLYQSSSSHSCTIVMEQGKAVGILTDRDLVNLSAQGAAFDLLTAAEVMSQPITYQWNPTSLACGVNPVFAMLNLLRQHSIRHLLVVNEAEELLGVATPERLLKLLNPMDMLRMRTMAEVMSPHVVYLSGQASVLDVAQKMSTEQISCVVIIEQRGEEVYPLGIITERDIVQFKVLDLDLANHSAEALMSVPLCTLQPQNSLWQAYEIMEQRRFRHMVVVDDRGVLAGILTQTNLLQLLEPSSLYEINLMLQQRLIKVEAEKHQQLLQINQTFQESVEQTMIALSHQLRRGKLISQISQHIHNSLNLQEVLDIAVLEIRTFLNCDRVMICQFAADWSGLIVAKSVDDAHIDGLNPQISDTCFQDDSAMIHAYRSGQVFMIADIHAAELTDCHRVFLEQFQIRANLVVPILLSTSHADAITEEPLWGLLIANQCDRPRQWQTNEVETLQEVSIQLANAIQHINTHIRFRFQLAERQRMEFTLRLSEQSYASLAEAVPVGIFRTDEEGLCLYVNEWWCQIAGLTFQESLGFGWIQAIHPEDRDQIATAWANLTHQQRPFQLEYRFQHPNGHVIWVYGQAIAECADNGEIVGYVGTVTDISHRKHAEEQVQHQLDILEGARDLIASADASGRITYLNQAGRDMIRLDPTEDVAQTFIPDYHPPEVAALILQEALSQCVQTGYWAGETKFLRRDGSEFPAWQIIVTHYRQDGTISHFSTIGRDISEMKRNEAELQRANEVLRQSEAKNRAMLQAMPDLMFQIDREGIFLTDCLGNQAIDILYTNPVGRSITELLPPEMAQRNLLAIHQALHTNQLQCYEQQFQVGDQQRYEEVRVIKSGDNEVVFIIRDITDSRTAKLAVYESEERLRLALSAAKQGLYDLNLQTGETVVTPEYATMLGYDPTTFQENNAKWLARLHPDDRETVSQTYQSYIAGKIPEYRVEFRQCTQSGDWKWTLSLGKIVAWDVQGQPLRMLGIHVDINNRKAAEQALATQRDFNQLIAELTSRFVNLKSETLNAEIERTLKLIGEFIQVEASYIFKFAKDGQSMSMIHEWCTPGFPHKIASLQTVPLTLFPWSTAIYQRRQILNIPSVAALPSEAAIDQASWQALDMKAVLAIPLIHQTEVTGFMGFALFRHEHTWNPEIIRLLQVVGHTITTAQERIQAEQNLRKREIQFRQVVENIQEMFFTYDYPAMELRYVSPVVEAVTGHTADELYADFSLFFQHIHSEDRAFVQTQFTNQDWQKPTNFEYRFIRLDDQLRWIHIKLFPLKTELGDVYRLIGVGRDITDRKQTELARLQAEKTRLELDLLENVLDTVLAGYWHTDIPNHQQYISPGFKRMFGYEDSELPNSPDTWKTLILPEDLPKALDNFERHVQSRGEIPYYNELRYRHKNGSTVWVICSGRVIAWDEVGNPLRMIGCHFDITERKKAEEALRKTKEEFELFFNGALDLFCIADTDGYFQRLNRAWENTLGYSLGELEGQNCLKFVHPDDREATLAAMSTLDDHQVVMGFVNRYRCKDGSYRDIEWYSRPYNRLIYAAARDITERRQAEAWLVKSDAHLRTAQRIGKLGSWEFEVQTGKVTWSEEVFRIFNWDSQVGPPSFDELQSLLHPDDRESHQQVVQTAIITGHSYEVELRAYHPDGTLVYIQVRGEPILDAAGQVIQLIGTVLDLTERKLAEQQIRDQTDRLTLATKSAAIGIWDWNIIDNCLVWDDRMYELYGLTSDTFNNAYEAWANSLHPDDRLTTETAIQQALTGEKDYDPEFRVVHPDGTIHVIKAYALVQRNSQGAPKRMIGINFDITDRKKAEEQIWQTSIQLEASNRELEAFAYSVSHDLRAPLRAIDGFSKALLEDYGSQFDKDAMDYFTRICNNVQRMGMLIEDLLRLSRVSRSEMQYTTVNLSELVKEQAEELQATDPDRCVTFIVVPNIIVTADPTLIRVVLDNLLRNAWKFTSHHATAHIEFGVTQIQNQCTYFVRDDGAGFDMTYANMLFRVFQRLHGTNEFPGTGIGLATVQRAIHRHGGHVWAEGAVEQGATIYFTLPHQGIELRSY